MFHLLAGWRVRGSPHIFSPSAYSLLVRDRPLLNSSLARHRARAQIGLMRNSPDAVTGAPRTWLRLEGLATFALAIFLYARGGHSWALLAVLFLAPDLSFVAYLAGPRVGAWGYNVAHSYVLPLLAVAASLAMGRPPMLALIWLAHIGFDRALGYGLKYPSAFQHTHLGRIGRASTSRPPG